MQVDQDFRDNLSRIRVLPVLTIRRLEDAVPLARALVAGGLNVLEVTLRTDVALDAIRLIAREVSSVVVGAGTVTHPGQVAAVLEAGGTFAVSPGLTPELGRACQSAGLPLVPGVMTPSEAMVARDAGFDLLKLFPAEAAGGVRLLRSFVGPLSELTFCPTGGIRAATAHDYLQLPNVLCVGGSWVAPRDAVANTDWQSITQLATEASQLP